MLTDRKFRTLFLLDFPLSSGTTGTVFAKSRKVLCFILELIDLVKSGVKKSTSIFISFGRIAPIPVVLEFNPCISFFYFNII